jgi:hypothetical protein
MTRLRLSIWPEYDDARVLVMFRGEMEPHSAFPTHITLPLPKGAEVIGAGMVSKQDELLLHPHQVTPGEAEDSLEINLPAARFFVEFYYNPFVEGTDKRFTYTVPTAYSIERLEVDIQQPLQAMRFTTEPQAMGRETDEQGFTYHRFIYHNLSKGDIRRFTVTYTKTVALPSVARGQPASEAIQHSRTAGRTLVLAFGMLIVAAVVCGGGTVLWTGYQRRRQASAAHQSPSISPQGVVQSHAPATLASMPTTAGRNTPNFCSNCGAQLRPEYRFCPGCGRPFHYET